MSRGEYFVTILHASLCAFAHLQLCTVQLRAVACVPLTLTAAGGSLQAHQRRYCARASLLYVVSPHPPAFSSLPPSLPSASLFFNISRVIARTHRSHLCSNPAGASPRRPPCRWAPLSPAPRQPLRATAERLQPPGGRM